VGVPRERLRNFQRDVEGGVSILLPVVRCSPQLKKSVYTIMSTIKPFTANRRMQRNGEIRAVLRRVLCLVRAQSLGSCGSFEQNWTLGISGLSTEGLLYRLREVLSMCTERQIGHMYASGVFQGSMPAIGVAVTLLRERGTATFACVSDMVRAYRSHTGE
jgi:hypothetical protein